MIEMAERSWQGEAELAGAHHPVHSKYAARYAGASETAFEKELA